MRLVASSEPPSGTSSTAARSPRLFSVRQSHVARMIHGTRNSLAAVQQNSQGSSAAVPNDTDFDFADSESTVLADIEVDDTLEHKDFFGVKSLCTPQILFKHKVHYGHKGTSLDPGMKQFVYGIRSSHVIFDLDITNYHLHEALNFTSHIALRDGIILFVARLPHCAHVIEKTAKDCGEFAHTRQWIPGTLTNIKGFQHMECRLPDLIICLSTLSEFGNEHPAVSEAAKLNIPTIAIVDSNCSPNLVTYPVPGNDDTPSSIELYCSLFQEAISRGKKERARRIELLEKEITKEMGQK